MDNKICGCGFPATINGRCAKCEKNRINCSEYNKKCKGHPHKKYIKKKKACIDCGKEIELSGHRKFCRKCRTKRQSIRSKQMIRMKGTMKPKKHIISLGGVRYELI